MYVGQTPDKTWLLCDGRGCAITDYPQLYAVIGNTFGAGVTPQYFQIPRLVNYFPLGCTIPYMGNTGGSNTANVVLSIENVPNHTHTISDPGHSHTLVDPGHTHVYATPNTKNIASAGGGGNGVTDNTLYSQTTTNSITNVTMGSSTTGITVQPTGGSQPFTIQTVPQYINIPYYIKAST